MFIRSRGVRFGFAERITGRPESQQPTGSQIIRICMEESQQARALVASPQTFFGVRLSRIHSNEPQIV